MNSGPLWLAWTREPSPSSSWNHETPPPPSKANCLFRLSVTSSNRRLESLFIDSFHSQPRMVVVVPEYLYPSWIVFQITVHKGDECALLNNSQPFKWKVLNRSGHEAVVPSVCFMVPPVNKEAVDSVSRWEHSQIKQNELLMWQVCI